MKNLSSFLIILISLYLWGCKESSTLVHGSGPRVYPDQLNNEWEYQTINTISFYNQSGGIDSTIELIDDNQIIKIVKTNDSLSTYKGLIKYETYIKYNPILKSNYWYLNSDTSFLAIAYYNPGVSVIQPKSNPINRYFTLADVKQMIYSFSPDISRFQKNTLDDSIQFYPIPRKVLAYPLNVGTTWVELYDPFYRERYVNAYLNITLGGQTYNCYEVKVHWPDYKIEFNDYISLEAGLVKRELIADSVFVTNPEIPFGTGTFIKESTVSTLVRKNF
jgi:hypothetical protein